MMINRIGDLLQKASQEKENFTLELFASKLLRIKERLSTALTINISSEKLITFLVEDFLDMG